MEASADRVGKTEMKLRHTPLARPSACQGSQRLECDAKVLLQCLPSGACFWLALETPIL